MSPVICTIFLATRGASLGLELPKMQPQLGIIFLAHFLLCRASVCRSCPRTLQEGAAVAAQNGAGMLGGHRVRLCLLALKQDLSDRPLLSMAVQRAAENAANQFLQPFGMFCRACSVGDYNSYPTVQGSRIRTIVHPETLEPILPSRILLVLGNDGGAWIPFISWLRQQPTLEDTPDSFDAFTSHVVHLLMQHLEAAGHSSLFWRQDTQTRPYTVIVQAAAHVSGMAHYETQLMWARHPVYAPSMPATAHNTLSFV